MPKINFWGLVWNTFWEPRPIAWWRSQLRTIFRLIGSRISFSLLYMHNNQFFTPVKLDGNRILAPKASIICLCGGNWCVSDGNTSFTPAKTNLLNPVVNYSPKTSILWTKVTSPGVYSDKNNILILCGFLVNFTGQFGYLETLTTLNIFSLVVFRMTWWSNGKKTPDEGLVSHTDILTKIKSILYFRSVSFAFTHMKLLLVLSNISYRSIFFYYSLRL